MIRDTQTNIVTAAARTSDGNSCDAFAMGKTNALFMLSITSVSGTSPTLDISVEGKLKSGVYATIASFPRVTEVGTQSLEVEHLPQLYRIRWAIAGSSASFTFEIDAAVISET